ncbi:MAG: lytic transglycosylase domain-containing protein [Pedosphaera sp.]|nr:lytic transglycosylase domain-containing protein [Pedosphaera sp.]MSU44169.1 lytic transglycosylase domain-containing protein [Pedosphaera sp.]
MPYARIVPRVWKWVCVLGAVAVLDTALLLWWRHHQLEKSQDPAILAAAARYGVEPALIKAVIWRESRFNPSARGAAGEIGLMQIREDAAHEWADAEQLREFHHAHLGDATSNALAGTWYLRKLLLRYPYADNPLPYALADYNAGRSRVLRWANGTAATNSTAFLQQMDFPGTRHYIRSILERRDHYRNQWPATNAPAR